MGPPIVNFPSLQPAIVWKVNAGAAHPVGMLQDAPDRGIPTLTVASSALRTSPEWLEPDPFRKTSLAGYVAPQWRLTEVKETPTGTIETVEGFEPRFKGKVVFGADWLEFDPDQKHARINMKAIATYVARLMHRPTVEADIGPVRMKARKLVSDIRGPLSSTRR